jgi:hypothetical protein
MLGNIPSIILMSGLYSLRKVVCRIETPVVATMNELCISVFFNINYFQSQVKYYTKYIYDFLAASQLFNSLSAHGYGYNKLAISKH